jgi:hypothetical protein
MVRISRAQLRDGILDFWTGRTRGIHDSYRVWKLISAEKAR